MTATTQQLSYEEWRSEALTRFGDAPKQGRFVCPVCGFEQCAQDFFDQTDLSEEEIRKVTAFSCIGRWIDGSRDAFSKGGEGPCSYAGGGLFRLNPVTVEFDNGKSQSYFAFAATDQGGHAPTK